MFDAQRLLGQLLGDALGGGFGHGRKRGGGLSFGAKAQLGLGALGVAMAAYEHYNSQRAPTATSSATVPPPPPAVMAMTSAPPPPPAAFNLAQLAPAQADAVLLVQAMIAAAAADGRVDASERERVLARASAAGVDAETRAFLEAEMAVPKSADAIGAMTRPGLTREAYAAAALTIDIDTESERHFLSTLGNALGLEEDERIAIHQQLGN